MTTSLNPFPEGARSPIRSTTTWTKRASGIPSSGVIHVTNLRIDTNKRQVYKGDERIRLTGMEFSLLELLVREEKRFPLGDFAGSVDTHLSAT